MQNFLSGLFRFLFPIYMLLCSGEDVAHQHRARHRADAAGYGGDICRAIYGLVKHNVPGELAGLGIAVHRHVYDCRAGLYHVPGNKPPVPCRDDEDPPAA